MFINKFINVLESSSSNVVNYCNEKIIGFIIDNFINDRQEIISIFLRIIKRIIFATFKSKDLFSSD